MRNIPIVTRYLLIANFMMWMLTAILLRYGISLNNIGGLHFYSASTFHFWQPVTYMFLHADFWHIFCNMFAVWMFGPIIEREWGAKRFLIYYAVCGLGAALVQEVVWSIMLADMATHYSTASVVAYSQMLNTIGASGAVFGILFAFGWLFPDVPMFLLFIPVPIRARVFVIIYALVELFAGLGSVVGLTADHVAHFAHLGGLLFGWLLILWWKHPEWKEKIFPRHPKLDSTKETDYEDYHYHKRV